jgi:hypothetical protein
MEFAYCSMRAAGSRRAAPDSSRKRRWMNYWGAWFYRPKIRKGLDIGMEGTKGISLTLPTDPSNWRHLSPHIRRRITARIEQMLAMSRVKRLAIDRREKSVWQDCAPDMPAYCGDLFLKLLALVMIEHVLARQGAEKLIFVGWISGYEALLEYAGRFHLPLSLQNMYPGRMEPLQNRLLYEKGLALSNSQFRPREWRRQDLVVAFSDIRALSALAPQTTCLTLDDGRSGLAPAVEERLASNGVDGTVAALAPIMEACLLRDREVADADQAPYYPALLQEGRRRGLWRPFLDNCS